MKYSSFYTAVFSLMLLTASGCSSSNPVRETPTEFAENLLASADKNVLQQQADASVVLAESAVSVSHALNQLASVEKAIHPGAKLPAFPHAAKADMSAKATLDWTGPVEPLLNHLAKATTYKLRVLGKAPAIPVIVSINAKNTALADIIRDIQFQARKAANVLVYPKRKTIELRYLGA